MTTMSKVTNPALERELNKLNELSDEQLDKVTGADLHFTKVIDKSSPNLFVGCATGKHYS